VDYEQAYREQQQTLAGLAAAIAQLTKQNAELLAKVGELTDMLAKKPRKRKRSTPSRANVSDLSDGDIDRP